MRQMVAPGEEPVPYWVRLKQLRQAAGLSQPELYRESGVSFGTIRALEVPYQRQEAGANHRSRYPTAEALEKLSAALGVEPAVWPEYRLARARQLLDEREVGLEQALSALEAFDSRPLTEAPESERAGSAGFEVPTVPQELRDRLSPRREGPPRDEDTRRKRGSEGRGA